MNKPEVDQVIMEIEGSRSGLRKGAWSAHEDLLLASYIHKHGEGNWHLIPKTAGLNRCRKSCRLRWLNYLSPNIKRGKFEDDEIDLILRLHKLLGNRWSLIAGRIPGRTANDVKNFWNTRLKKNQNSNSSNEKVDIIPKFHTPSKVEVIRPRTKTLSKRLFFLKEKLVISELEDNLIQNQSNTTIEEHDLNHISTLNYWKSLYNELNVNSSSNDMPIEEGDNYWQHQLSTSYCLASETTLEANDVSSLEQQTIPQLNVDWDDFLWENMDISGLL